MYHYNYSKIITFCLFTLSQTLFSQITLQGIITDNGTEPVHNALVKITDQADTNRTFNDYSNEQGEYSIQITSTSIDNKNLNNPDHFTLLQNYPNPFNPSTVISYEITQPAVISIEIYNVLGQKIKTLLDKYLTTRSGQVIWDATNDLGQGVSAGVYIYSLKTNNIRINKKMLLIDGQYSNTNGIISNTTENNVYIQNSLNKQMSNQYTLQVTGNNIETYKQQNLEITSNMTLDIIVIRTVTDKDGNVYKTVKIGNQWWMAENLKVIHYRNGDTIPNVTDNSTWVNLTNGAHCNYGNNTSNINTYGRLYHWYTINDSRNIAPAGWHVPTDEEWKELEMYLGMSKSEAEKSGAWRGIDEGGKLKQTGLTLWNNPNIGANNESGFTALPGGARSNDGIFDNIGNSGYFWTNTAYDNDKAIYRTLNCKLATIHRGEDYKYFGLSIRCVKGLGAPILLSPSNKEAINNNTPSFDWSDVDNAVIYELVVDDSSDFSTPEISQNNLTSSSYIPDSSLSDNTYHWHVRCKDSASNWSPWSNKWSFTIDTQGPASPTLLTPADSSTVTDNTPSFNWTDVSDAVSFELMVDDSSDFSSPEINQNSLTDSSFTPDSSLSDDTYHWRVCCKDSMGNRGDWSSVWSFTIDTQGPVSPTLLTPADSSTITDNTPSFTWTDVSDAVTFELMVDDSSDFSSPEISKDGLTDSSFTPDSSLLDDTYYWRVCCKDSVGNRGDWSSVWSFTIDTQGPTPPTLLSPVNGSSISDNTPSFDWLDVGDAVKYKLVVDNSSNFSSPEISKYNLSYSFYSPSSSLSSDTYYWRVQCKDSPGNWGDWSSVWSFTITGGTGTVTDIDGNVYQTVKIGNQWWMAENLKVTRYRNGDTLSNVTDNGTWASLTIGAYCNYDNNPSNGNIYGRLYNWYAVNDSRKIAPTGWHVPSDAEWKQLEMNLGMSQSEADKAIEWRGTNEGSKLKSTNGWSSGGNGTNESGFNALPAGYRDREGPYHHLLEQGTFLTTTQKDADKAWHHHLHYNYDQIWRSYSSKGKAFSVRCVKN
jgi:uncharacterized protein (TIGR02145 family)